MRCLPLHAPAPEDAPGVAESSTPRRGDAKHRVRWTGASWLSLSLLVLSSLPTARAVRWRARHSHAAVEVPNEQGVVLILGGCAVTQCPSADVWRSSNRGANWTNLNATNAWSARQSFPVVAMPQTDDILLLGGDASNNGSLPRGDVWASGDGGVTWSRVTASANWTARYAHAAVVDQRDDSVLVLGGQTAQGLSNEVWRSSDGGLKWTRVQANTTWSARRNHAAVALTDGTILVVGGWGGTYLGDIWRTTNGGIAWQRVLLSAPWAPRLAHALVAMSNTEELVLLGGSADGGGGGSVLLNDVWRSSDLGLNWTRAVAAAGWSTRRGHAAVALSGGGQAEIMVLGGLGAGDAALADVWLSCGDGRSVGKAQPADGNTWSVCTTCAAGTSVPSLSFSTSCSDCQAGSFSASAASKCTTCEAGTYSAAARQASCVDCPKGASSLAGSSSCTACTSGTYAPEPGSPLCLPCPIGKVSPSNSHICGSCRIGTRPMTLLDGERVCASNDCSRTCGLA